MARILYPIATGTVERALTAHEVDACYAEVKALESFLEGVRTGAIKVDEDRVPISERRPALSADCADLVGGEENVEARGIEALLGPSPRERPTSRESRRIPGGSWWIPSSCCRLWR